MFYFVLAIHLFLCLVLVTLVLLQQGKGASVGAVFSGSSNTLFGASGANTVLTKVTTGVAVAFMVTSVILVRMYGSQVTARAGSSNPLEGSALAGSVVQTAPVSVPASSSLEATSSEAAPAADQPKAAGQVSSSDAVSSVPAPQQEKPANSDAVVPDVKSKDAAAAGAKK